MLHYTKQGTGTPIILIHGFPFDHLLWTDVAHQLAQNYCVICPDLPGTGKSPENLLTFEEMANQINEILIYEKISKAIIAGHSMGGYITLAFAEKYPEKLIALGLINSTGLADNEVKKAQRNKTIALVNKGEDGKNAFLHAMAPGMFSKNFGLTHPEKLKYLEDSGRKMSAATVSNFQLNIKNRKDQQNLLSNIQVPIFWTIGDEDNATPASESWKQVALCPQVDVHLYNSCGHCSMIERPDELAKDLIHFLNIIN